MFHKSKVQIPTKIPSKKNDGAPMILFIDVLANNSFLNPILPTPLRIDKVTNGLSSSFIFPSENISLKMDDIFYTYDYEKLYSLTIQNLIFQSEKSYRAVCYRQLDNDKVNTWTMKTADVQVSIPTLSEDLDYILKSYLLSFIMYNDGMDEKESLKIYCEKMIDFFNKRIENNKIKVYNNGSLVEKAMYKEKRGKIFPEIVPYDEKSISTTKIKRKAFVPLLIYDDILECFIYNRQKLENSDTEYIHFDSMIDNKIIIVMDSEFDKDIKNEKILKQIISNIYNYEWQ